MRLGLIADVHEAIEFLAAALELFRREGVDRIVCAGDLVGAGDRLDEAAALMAGADVACVWGNHDYPLCRTIAAGEAGAHRPAATLDYFRTLRPRLEVGGAHFSHVEPWLDLGDPADLCYYGPPPETAEAAARSCAAVPHPWIFLGHFHRWGLVTLEGPTGWRGQAPIVLDPARRWVCTLGPLMDGRCALFDAATGRLEPIDLRDGFPPGPAPISPGGAGRSNTP